MSISITWAPCLPDTSQLLLKPPSVNRFKKKINFHMEVYREGRSPPLQKNKKSRQDGGYRVVIRRTAIACDEAPVVILLGLLTPTFVIIDKMFTWHQKPGCNKKHESSIYIANL